MRLHNYITGINGVGAGNKALANIPTGPRYHGLKLFVGATVGGNPSTDPIAILDKVELVVDSIVIRELTPTEILAMNSQNGLTAEAGELPIHFSNPKRATLEGQEATAWPTKTARNFQVKAAFKAAAVNPTLAIEAEFDYGAQTVVRNGVVEEFLAIERTDRITQYVPAGAYDFNSQLPIKYPIQALLFAASAGTISEVQVKRDGEIVREHTAAQNAAFLKNFGIDPTQFSFPELFDYTRQLTDALTGVRFEANPSGIKDLNVRVNCTNANTITLLVVSRVPGFI